MILRIIQQTDMEKYHIQPLDMKIVTGMKKSNRFLKGRLDRVKNTVSELEDSPKIATQSIQR